MADRKALLVLGMHRSGSSVVARLLNMLGASLPRSVLPERIVTPIGRSEPFDIVSIHDDLLRSAGTKWSDWSRFPESWYDSPYHELFVERLMGALRENFGTSSLFVVKDPRMARFVPVWLEALSRLGIEPVAVIPYRNPIEVAQSLMARDRSTLGHGLLLWLRHCLDAEAQTRGLPRCFVSYDSLVGESQMTAYRIMEALPIAWPRKTAQAISEIAEFVDTGLHHQRAPLAGLLHPEMNEAVIQTHAGLAALARDEADGDARARLDAVRSDLDRTATMTFAAFEEMAADRRRLDRDIARLDDRIGSLMGELAPIISELRLSANAAAAAAQEVGTALHSRVESLVASFETALDTRSGDLEALRLDVVATAATLQASQASADAELDAVGERLRRLTGRLSLDAFEAGRMSWSRVRKALRRTGDTQDQMRRFVLSTGLFDPEWYSARYHDEVPSVAGALDHYVSVGFSQNRDPGPAFDATWYLDANPDVRQADLPALAHYVQTGIAEGRRGRPRPAACRPESVETENEP